jgi:hypothetical protein
MAGCLPAMVCVLRRRPDGSGYLAWNFAADPYLEYDLFFKREFI